MCGTVQKVVLLLHTVHSRRRKRRQSQRNVARGELAARPVSLTEARDGSPRALFLSPAFHSFHLTLFCADVSRCRGNSPDSNYTPCVPFSRGATCLTVIENSGNMEILLICATREYRAIYVNVDTP